MGRGTALSMDHGLISRRLVFAKSKNRHMTKDEFGSRLVTSVFTIVLAFLCSSFTDFALVLERNQVTSVFLDSVVVGASVGAPTTTVTCA